MDPEVWRLIPGYDDCYEASSEGQIRRSKANNSKSVKGGGGWKAGYILAQSTDKAGYHKCNLWDADLGRQKSVYVHRLVAAAFHGEPPTPEHTVNHIDGHKGHNAADNLEWATKSENYRHALNELGFQPRRGSEHWNVKFTEDTIREIRRRAAAGEGYRTISEDTGMLRSSISLVVNRKLWKHVD